MTYACGCYYFQQLCEAGFNWFNCTGVKAESQRCICQNTGHANYIHSC